MNERVDILIIGGGPAGQKAAICAAKTGAKVALVEREPRVGGECVRRGTIPSKALRECAANLHRLRACARRLEQPAVAGIPLANLMGEMNHIVDAHCGYMGRQLTRNGVEHIHGRARFRSRHHVEVASVGGPARQIQAETILVATGSRPRRPPEIAIDHEHILDSDSILSMTYLPRSLVVLGGGVISCEYASVFASLGVEVTIVDRADRPLAFLDEELSRRFVMSFERAGGRYLPNQNVDAVTFDGFGSVHTQLGSTSLVSDKVLVALGRVPNTAALDLAAAGIPTDHRGRIKTNASGQSEVDNIYAAGDVAGPPGLASAAMEQGRRAISHALGQPEGPPPELIPIGIFTIPELGSVGLSEAVAQERGHRVVVGRAFFDEVARGQIAGIQDGILKLVVDADSRRLLGVHIAGDGATELVHVGQMALIAEQCVDTFVDHIFNFPTLAEAYRIAGIDALNRCAEAPIRIAS